MTTAAAEKPDDSGSDTRASTSRGDAALGTRITGWAVAGALAAGAVALVGALVSLLTFQLPAVGMCALGAGVAFGLLANAALRR